MEPPRAIALFLGLPFELHAIVASYIYSRVDIENLRRALRCTGVDESEAAHAQAAYRQRAQYLAARDIDGEWEQYRTVVLTNVGKHILFHFHAGGINTISFLYDPATNVKSLMANTTGVRGPYLKVDSESTYQFFDVGTEIGHDVKRIAELPHNAAADRIDYFSVSPNGRVIVGDNLVFVRNERMHGGWEGVKELPFRFPHGTSNTLNVVFSPDSSILAVNMGSYVFVCDILNRRSCDIVNQSSALYSVYRINFSPSGKYLVIAWPMEIAVYLRATLTLVATIPEPGELAFVAFRPNEEEYFYFTAGSHLFKYETRTGVQIFSAPLPPRSKKLIALFSAGLLLVHSPDAGFILYRDTGSGISEVRRFMTMRAVADFAVDEHGTLVYATMQRPLGQGLPHLSSVKRLALY